ncbi:MAG: hypothetical protein ACTHJ9_00080 [Rhodanobacter sp.]
MSLHSELKYFIKGLRKDAKTAEVWDGNEQRLMLEIADELESLLAEDE